MEEGGEEVKSWNVHWFSSVPLEKLAIFIVEFFIYKRYCVDRAKGLSEGDVVDVESIHAWFIKNRVIRTINQTDKLGHVSNASACVRA